MTTSTKPCPINWTKEDGPCPCAFKDRYNKCESRTECIEMYEERYQKDLLDATTPVVTSCPRCGNTAFSSRGNLKKGGRPFAPPAPKSIKNNRRSQHTSEVIFNE